MPQRHIGGRRVHTELDPKWRARFRAALQLGAQIGLGDDPIASPFEHFDLFVNLRHAAESRAAIVRLQ
jgi:hypothetical protein